ncbi:unnamed protein product [Durusdinium trenchii]|uniref:Uncharacterized protein n=2 Tax=Durusdinium trenchii TaxID=1381693 RepID=A0ABP0K7U0_9DINO
MPEFLEAWKSDDPEMRRIPSKTSTRSMMSKSVSKLSEVVEQRQVQVLSSQEEWWTYEFAHVVAKIVWMLFFLATSLLVFLLVADIHPEAFVITFFVMFIAQLAYFAKVTGYSDVVLGGRTVPIVRYIDWITTTPLMLFELCMIGGAEKHTTILVIGCDLIMHATGIVSAMVVPKEKVKVKYAWFTMSVFCFTLMLLVLHRDVSWGTVNLRPSDVQALFDRLEWLTIISWSWYPIVVLLGRAHFGIISKGTEDALLCILDCIAKLGMEGFVVLSCTAPDAQCHAK